MGQTPGAHRPAWLGVRKTASLGWGRLAGVLVVLGLGVWACWPGMANPGGLSAGAGLSPWALLGVLALWPLNQGLEVAKWRVALPMRPWRQAWADVLAGQAAGFVSPARLGEPIGRLAALPHGLRPLGVVGTLAGRLAQAWATVLAGLVAGVAVGWPLVWQPLPTPLVQLLVALALVVVALVALAASPLPWARQLRAWVAHHRPPALPPRAWASLGALALLRYGVFALQYALALWAAGVAEPLGTLAPAIALTYLLRLGVPGLGLGEAGVREAVALGVMGAWGLPAGPVWVATVGLYVLNQVLPAAMGWLWGARRLRNQRPGAIPATQVAAAR